MKTAKKRLILAVLSFSLLTFSSIQPVRADGINRFVVPSLGATTGACPQNDPCTLAYALSIAADGDTIYLEGGYYDGVVKNLTSQTLTMRGGWDGSPTGGPLINTSLYETRILGTASVRAFESYLFNSKLTLEDLTLAEGAITGDGGGASFTTSTVSTVDLNRVIVESNGSSTTTDYGGGISATHIQLNITDCVFNNNHVKYGGGALELTNTITMITRTIFESNQAEYGAAIEIQDSSTVDIDRSVFKRNTGSGIVLVSDVGPLLVMRNSFLLHNTGTPVRAMGGEVNLLNNTFAADPEPQVDTAVFIFPAVTGEMCNNLIYHFGVSIYKDPANPSYFILHTLFYDNLSDPSLGSNYVTENPYLLSPPADEDGYHIGLGSAAFNAGETLEFSTDYDGDPRPLFGYFDIGADEWTGLKLFLPIIFK
jgi:hypothetical protein